jgi:hypothetical protein
LLGFRRAGPIPFPEFIGITAASENDLMVAEPVEVLRLRNFLAMKYTTG